MDRLDTPSVAGWLPPQSCRFPVLDETCCTGCGVCVSTCPTQCLTKGTWTPYLARPLDCVSCSVCVLVCPAGAIWLPEPIKPA